MSQSNGYALLQDESFSRWCAVAILRMEFRVNARSGEALVCLGRSSDQVRADYAARLTEPDHVSWIELRQWEGSSNCGKWVFRAELKHPKRPRGEDDDPDDAAVARALEDAAA